MRHQIEKVDQNNVMNISTTVLEEKSISKSFEEFYNVARYEEWKGLYKLHSKAL